MEDVSHVFHGDVGRVHFLFSGALGLDIGLDRAGFSICVAIEKDNYAVETIK